MLYYTYIVVSVAARVILGISNTNVSIFIYLYFHKFLVFFIDRFFEASNTIPIKYFQFTNEIGYSDTEVK